MYWLKSSSYQARLRLPSIALHVQVVRIRGPFGAPATLSIRERAAERLAMGRLVTAHQPGGCCWMRALAASRPDVSDRADLGTVEGVEPQLVDVSA